MKVPRVVEETVFVYDWGGGAGGARSVAVGAPLHHRYLLRAAPDESNRGMTASLTVIGDAG